MMTTKKRIKLIWVTMAIAWFLIVKIGMLKSDATKFILKADISEVKMKWIVHI